MAFINYATREINVKIVYYGAGHSGKTTNVQFLHRKLNPKNRGRMISLETETERTLFFDFMPVWAGQIRGFTTRLHLYTVPGQIFYAASRALILRGADGVVFVADSQIERMEANLELLENLNEHLLDHQQTIETMPMVMQFNKRDSPQAVAVEDMSALLNPFRKPEILAVASKGDGVFATLREAGRQALRRVRGC